MALKESESWYVKHGKAISLGLYIWLAVGVVVSILAFIYYWPPGPTLGYPWSPHRILLADLGAVMVMLPIILILCKKYADNQKWLAEDMGLEYEPGKRYPLWTTRRLVGIAIGAALFGASGFLTLGYVDVPMLAASFCAILLGPIGAFLSLTIGWILIRYPLAMGIWDPTWWPLGAFLDGGIWTIAGYFYHRFIRGRKLKRKAPMYILYTVVVVAVHMAVFVGWMVTCLSPAPAVYVDYMNWLASYPLRVLWVFVSLVAADASWRYLYGYR